MKENMNFLLGSLQLLGQRWNSMWSEIELNDERLSVKMNGYFEFFEKRFGVLGLIRICVMA